MSKRVWGFCCCLVAAVIALPDFAPGAGDSTVDRHNSTVDPTRRSTDIINGITPSGSSFVTWRVVDSASSILGYQNRNLKPYFFDPESGTHTLIHRGDITSYAPTSGACYMSISTNAGSSWVRSDILFDGAATSSRSSISIYSPGSNLANAYIFAAYPLLYGDPPSTGDMGIAYDRMNSLFGDGSFEYYHTMDTSFDVAHQTWSSGTQMFCSATIRGGSTGTGRYRNKAIYRFDDFSPFPLRYNISSTDTHHVLNSYAELGGDWIRVGTNDIVVYGFIGNFYITYSDTLDSAVLTGPTIGVVSSTDDGLTWGELDYVDLTSLAPDLGVYTHLGQYGTGLTDISGDMLIDSLGYPHIVVGLQEQENGVSGTNMAIGEIYKTGTGWHGKIVGALNPNTRYDYGERMGYHPMLSRNDEGTLFACQYVDSYSPSNIPDLWASARKWNSANWNPVFNATETPSRGEAYAHLAPRLKQWTGALYTMFSTFAYWKDSTYYGTGEDCSPCRTYLYAGEIPVFAGVIDPPQVLTWTYPSPGYTVTLDSILSDLRLTVRNPYADTTDSLIANLRILNESGTEFLTESRMEAPLAPYYQRVIHWQATFAPPVLGTYSFQAIIRDRRYPPAPYDTNTIYVKVVEPSTITKSEMEKRFHPYELITNPDMTFQYAQGDDDDCQEVMALPFRFSYNGQLFDSIQFSTNGWVQLGKAGSPRDTMWGLITPSSIGNNENNRGFSSTGPFNAFGAWWEDMKVDAAESPDAGLSITTLGTTPNRVFVIQWRNMLGYYDSTLNDVRVNFQVRMYESSSILEFHYGNVTGTQFGGTDTGAMISLKDEIGGDYHYLDVYQNKTGQVANGNTCLNPLRDWPGPDSMYMVFPSFTSVTSSYRKGWTMVSMPLLSLDYHVSRLFPGATGVWICDQSGYRFDTLLPPGIGGYLKFGPSIPQVVKFQGSLTAATRLYLHQGWNMIGSHGVSVPAPISPLIVPGTCYGYNNGYVSATTIEPGKAYWVKAASAGTVALTPFSPKVAAEYWNAYNSITITDQAGASQQLYVAEDAKGSFDMDRYEMPPVPPQGMFDARFKSSRILEAYRPTDNAVEYPIVLQGAAYPLTVACNVNNGSKGLELLEVENGNVVARHLLNGNGTVIIAKGNANSLVIKVSEARTLPKEFALGQNYPNPFNPTTRVEIQLPQDARVEVAVYDILGRKIKTLLNDVRPAGYHTIEWNATTDDGFPVPSGVYFLRMTSVSFTRTQKMLLVQ